MVARGQVWSYVQGSRQYRVLVISNDEFNALPAVGPWALRVDRAPAGAPVVDIDLLIRMTGDDPLPGAYVNVPAVVRVDETALRDNLGVVSHATMAAVEHAIRDFLELP
jgi:mRNA-degrading endonuclease toxin of MazEF toxin-antitoxin module